MTTRKLLLTLSLVICCGLVVGGIVRAQQAPKAPQAPKALYSKRSTRGRDGEPHFSAAHSRFYSGKLSAR